jgi:Spy/CpxP family protein refolding chaperone
MKPARWLIGCLLAALLFGAAQRPARAQTEPIPAEVAALFDDINDIDKLRILNPLKLTTEQIDRLIAAIKQAQSNYNKRLADAAVPPIRQIAQEIKETRRRMLAGESVPKNFDEKVKKLQDEFIAKRTKEDSGTLKSLSDTIHEILTPDQVKKAVKLAKDLTEEDGKPTLKGSDDQFFRYYVLHTFILYPRTVPLLEDMKKAAGGGSARNSLHQQHARR